MDLTDKYMHVFSTNHMCVRGSFGVQGFGITGVLLPGLETGLEGSRRLTIKSCFSGSLIWRGQCALWPGCDGCAGEQSSASVFTCMSFQEFQLFPWEECSSLTFFTSEGIIANVCGFSSFEVGNMQTMVAHPGCSFRKICFNLMLMKI